ncbi:MAG: MBL fold metallo-hydrolase [Actinobacteria bacterium]|nr:MBL fold metallo-hydrolase [Actinomycetota bacterium]
MSTSFRFLGAAGFEIVGPQHRILVDPFLTGSPLAPLAPEDLEAPDVILVSHAAPDHYGDTAAIAKRTGSPVVCGADVRLHLMDEGVPETQIQTTIWGVVVEVGGVMVRPVECHHWSMAERADGSILTGTPLSFIVETEPGVSVYHYGDTSIFDMRLIGELYAPTVGLIGCTQPFEIEDHSGAGREVTGEMTPDEAARAAEMLGVDLAVGCHYLSLDANVAEFLRLVPEHDSSGRRRALAPQLGETFVVEPAPSADGSRRAALAERR